MDKVIRYSRRAVTEKYATFSGRDNRAQYWWFVLGVVIVGVVLSILGGASDAVAVLSTLFSIAVFLPTLAATTRRLHDTGRSGWWQLIQLVPIVGLIVIIYFTVQDSSPQANAYGPVPTEGASAPGAMPPPPPPPPPVG